MSYPTRGSKQRGGGAPSLDEDLIAESIIGVAIPLRRNSCRIPDKSGPLLHRVRRPAPGVGIVAKRIEPGADTTVSCGLAGARRRPR